MAFCGALILLIVPFLCAAADADTNGTVKNVNQTDGLKPPPRGFSILTREEYEPIPFGGEEETGSEREERSGFITVACHKNNCKNNRTGEKYIEDEIHQFLASKWMSLFIPSVYSFVFAMSLPLNFLSMLVFVAKRKLKKPAVVYMLNLTLSDVLFTVLLPFKISYHVSGNDWYFGPGMCRIVTAAFYCNMYCSVLLITCISVDRFLAVVYPVHSRSWRSTGRASLVCIITWLVAIVGCLPLLCTEQTAEVPGLNITSCHDFVDLSKSQDYYLYFFPCFSLIFFFVPLAVTTFCYFRILRCLCSTNAASKHRRTRAIFLAFAVLLVFIVCFLPTNVLLVVHYLQFSNGHNNETYFVYLLSLCVGSLNCSIDPIIYYGGSSKWQKDLYKLVCCVTGRETFSSSSNSQSSSRDSRAGTISSKISSSIYKKLLA
ncbi:proteinase-activated receptor 1 isoform X1 [Protopterus annectens]|uniref:proteinase-activated receptor 1 isoform X1 n=1 Tax=Protopterus annectens TaxID=7888 RepID=UPI001CFA8843|nr:proteinase-activated receptor 1 isoform X1 [Protopterus annectens]